MNNTVNYTTRPRLIPSESTSEWFFIVLVCMFWASGLFGFIFVAADKVLGTDMFIRTIGKTILFIIFAICSLKYCSTKIRMQDLALIFLFILFFFLSSGPSLMPALQFEDYTRSFLWALPLYLIGISLDFPKIKNLVHIFTIASIVVGAYYQLVFIHGTGYSGSAEFKADNMSAAYGFLLPTMFMIWYTFSNFSIKSVFSWIDLSAVTIGVFSMLMLGTRGPVVATAIFVALYLLFFKIVKHKVLNFLLFAVVIYLLLKWADVILLFFGTLSADLGFSDRIFTSFLSDENIFAEGSSGRDAFYPILFKALSESPVFGYGLFGSYKFIGTYPHNIFMEILVSFGYVGGGAILLYCFTTLVKAFRNNLSEDEKGFLFVLFGAGIVGLLFSSMFIITPAFFLFLGYCIQMAYRKK